MLGSKFILFYILQNHPVNEPSLPSPAEQNPTLAQKMKMLKVPTKEETWQFQKETGQPTADLFNGDRNHKSTLAYELKENPELKEKLCTGPRWQWEYKRRPDGSLDLIPSVVGIEYPAATDKSETEPKQLKKP